MSCGVVGPRVPAADEAGFRREPMADGLLVALPAMLLEISLLLGAAVVVFLSFDCPMSAT